MTVQTLNSRADITNATCCQALAPGEQVSFLSYYPPIMGVRHFLGGRVFAYDPDRPKADHDGGTYLSTTCPWDGTRATLEDYHNGVGDTDPTGTGCLVLLNPLEVYVEDYGAVGGWTSMASAVDDWAAFDAAVNRKLHVPGGGQPRSGIVRARDTIYYLTKTLKLKQPVAFRGAYSQLAGARPCELLFATDTTGLYVDNLATSVFISGFTVTSWSGTNPDVHGLWMRFRAQVEYCQFRQFGGNGVHMVATSGSSDPERDGNVNGWSLFCVKCDNNGGDGVFVDGADSNAGTGYRVDCVANGGWGINDSSFLGNTWTACHTAFNTLGAYQADGPNARSLFLGCYSEQGQPPSNIVSPSLYLGGLHGAGFTAESNGGTGNGLKLDLLTANTESQVVKGSSKQSDYFVARNTNGSRPATSYETGFMSYCSIKADGSPRPSGGMFTSPYQSNRSHPTQVGWYVYTGEDTDTLVKVARFLGTDDLSPTTDNLTSLGHPGGQWKDIYLVNNPTVSSDERLKMDIRPLDLKEQAVAAELKTLIRAYRRRDEVDKFGDAAVIHTGVIAQDVARAFRDEGLEPLDYAILQHGEASDRYSVRYEQLLAFIISAL